MRRAAVKTGRAGVRTRRAAVMGRRRPSTAASKLKRAAGFIALRQAVATAWRRPAVATATRRTAAATAMRRLAATALRHGGDKKMSDLPIPKVPNRFCSIDSTDQTAGALLEFRSELKFIGELARWRAWHEAGCCGRPR
ncbi:hypothetical protein CAOG_009919 [Capsaspora owczarzaki ATCC 30864]|uniref:Uncharacterized protein n=1 Tax=Capsaspora owczarzaki (strain ATCC 30864) TaxID=595528 RepID=A0A0D2WSU1_CAPO3|nr:hypothetical protein CAOG_009919 [Capsaspora owczarzaki ATCC 30864]